MIWSILLYWTSSSLVHLVSLSYIQFFFIKCLPVSPMYLWENRLAWYIVYTLIFSHIIFLLHLCMWENSLCFRSYHIYFKRGPTSVWCTHYKYKITQCLFRVIWINIKTLAESYCTTRDIMYNICNIRKKSKVIYNKKNYIQILYLVAESCDIFADDIEIDTAEKPYYAILWPVLNAISIPWSPVEIT